MRTIRKGLLVIVLTMLALTGTAEAAKTNNCETGEIFPILEPAFGESKLCVKRKGLTADMQIRGLNAGHPYTVWWVYFDDPSLCVDGGPGVCGDADFFGDDPVSVLGRMDSGVAKPNGRLHVRGRVGGLEPSSGAEIWLLVFGHGPLDEADGRHRARQLLTPEDPSIGAPHLGIEGQPFGFPVAISIFVVE